LEGLVRVLVAEDETTLSKQLAAALGEAGYAVDCAPDGERADFLGQTERYDAIVLDLGLPKIDGLTLLARWRNAGISVPVLVLTARGSWHEKVQGIDGAPTTTCRSRSGWRSAARLRADSGAPADR
jgi:two-component system OmpR family response regulator